jgi:hypothetical protein
MARFPSRIIRKHLNPSGDFMAIGYRFSAVGRSLRLAFILVPQCQLTKNDSVKNKHLMVAKASTNAPPGAN